MKKLFLILFVVILSFQKSNAQLFTYTFSGTALTCPATQGVPLTSLPANVYSVSLGRTGVVCSATNDCYNSTNWSLSTSIDQTQYIELIVIAMPGYILNVNSINFTTLRSGTGPANGRIDNDGGTGSFSANNAFAISSTTTGYVNWDFTDFSTSAGGTAKFRIYGWNATGTSGAFRIDDLALNATVTPASPLSFDYINGRVGIGTSSSLNEKLEINGNIKTQGLIIPTNAGIGKILTSDANGTGTWQAASTSSSVWSIASNNIDVCNSNSGNTGIGTCTPLTKLHVYGGDFLVSTSVVNVPDVHSGVGGGGVSMVYWNGSKEAFRAGGTLTNSWDNGNVGMNSFAGGWTTVASGENSVALGAEANATGRSSIALGDQTSSSGDYSTSTGVMTNASGNYSTAMGSESVASGDNSVAIGTDVTAASLNSTALGAYNIGGGNPLNWVLTDPLLEIGNGEYGAPSNALTILKNGNTGIGTIAPQAKLDINGTVWVGAPDATVAANVFSSPSAYALAVNGTALFTKAVVRLYTNWPDYVFDDNYKLQPIADFEKYLKQNKHLPYLPAADQIKKDGIDLGSNQAALLKTMEEFSLYIIEQNKKIEVLEKENLQLKDMQKQIDELKQMIQNKAK